MSGSYSDTQNIYLANEDSPFYWHGRYTRISGSVNVPESPLYGNIDPDVLWERMYVQPRPVIIVCGFCKSHNAITNPTCVQCGAPIGLGIERVFG